MKIVSDLTPIPLIQFHSVQFSCQVLNICVLLLFRSSIIQIISPVAEKKVVDFLCYFRFSFIHSRYSWQKKNVTSGWTSHLQRKWSTGNFHFELINQLRLDNPKLVDSLPVERHQPEVRVFPPGRRQVGGDEPNGRFTSASCHRKYSKDAIGLICIIEASLN